MKKVNIILICLSIVTCLNVNMKHVQASEVLYTSSIDLTEHDIDYYRSVIPDTNLVNGDTFINLNDLNAIDDSQNEGISLAGTYEYQLAKIETSKAYGVVKCKYITKVAANTSTTQSTSFSYSFQTACETYSLETAVTVSTSYQRNGPSSTDKVDSTTYATHYYYFNVASGKVMKYTYNIIDQYTGESQGTVIKYYVTNQSNNNYSILANLNAASGMVKFRSISSSRIVNESESTLISYLNKSTGYSHVY